MRCFVVAFVACVSLVGCGDSGSRVPLDDVDSAVSLYASASQPFVDQIAQCFELVARGHPSDASTRP